MEALVQQEAAQPEAGDAVLPAVVPAEAASVEGPRPVPLERAVAEEVPPKRGVPGGAPELGEAWRAVAPWRVAAPWLPVRVWLRGPAWPERAPERRPRPVAD